MALFLVTMDGRTWKATGKCQVFFLDKRIKMCIVTPNVAKQRPGVDVGR